MPSSTHPRLVVGNWKMNGLLADLSALTAIAEAARRSDEVEVALALPAPLIYPAAQAVGALPIGAQDIHPHARGAFTGGVSAAMVRDVGGRFTLVGHSERRRGEGETDAVVRAKAQAAHEQRLGVILCLGEDTKAPGMAEAVVLRQLARSAPAQADGSWLSIAYEPVWAIGSGQTPSPGDITAMHAALRSACALRFGEAGRTIRLLYGGSVTAQNAAAILALDNVDGVLVGGASLDAAAFVPIVRSAQALADQDGHKRRVSGEITPQHS
jgi:triosephosphate isomerase